MNISFFSYLIGLLQTDGTHAEYSRNRGRVVIELSERDSDVLLKISEHLPEITHISKRNRNTNFKKNVNTVILSIYDINFRTKIKKYVPVGKKSNLIHYFDDLCEFDYWRGIIDGDGSLGITAKNIPYISLITKSKLLASDYIEFIKKHIGVCKTTTQNKRDSAYNILLTNENAQKLINLLYYDNCVCMNRKYEKSKIIMSWRRLESVKKITWNVKKWTSMEDDYILTHSIYDSIEHLKRTEKSIRIRLYRLTKH